MFIGNRKARGKSRRAGGCGSSYITGDRCDASASFFWFLAVTSPRADKLGEEHRLRHILHIKEAKINMLQSQHSTLEQEFVKVRAPCSLHSNRL